MKLGVMAVADDPNVADPNIVNPSVTDPNLHDPIVVSPGPQFRAAMVLAIAADALQIILFPMFVEGAFSGAEDVLDIGVAALMVHLLGWHWEFVPSFAAKLVPGLDLVPLWTMAVVNVWRKAKQAAQVPSEKQPFLPLR